MANDSPQHKQAQAMMGGIPIPIDFLCPLSLELMSDPVIIASGKTYERTHIQHWLDQGNSTCPQTQEFLSDCNLVPNYIVKAMITNWCNANSASLPQLAKHETCASQVLPSKKTDPACQQEERVSSRSNIDEAFAGTRIRPGRSVRTRRTRSYENFDISKRETIPVVENNEEMKPVHVGDTDGQCQSIPSWEKHHLTDGMHGQGLNNTSTNAKHRNDASLTANTVGDNNLPASQLLNGSSPCSIALSGGLERMALSVDHSSKEELDSVVSDAAPSCVSWRRQVMCGNVDKGRIAPPLGSDKAEYDGNEIQLRVESMVKELQSALLDVQRCAVAELRQLSRHNVESRIIIANAGAIKPLVSLLRSTDSQIQEHAVTALLNLSINDNNKIEIAAADVFDPLISVLTVGTSKAKENAAATLYSLSIMNENRMVISQSGGIEPLVDLLMHGTVQGMKDAASALYNLSTLHENKGSIVQANAVRPLVNLISDPAAGMVDKAVAIVANLATIQAGRVSIIEEEGVPGLVEVVESGSQRGKEHAVATLLHLCTNSSRVRAKVLQEGVVPALTALSNTGTARAKEKAHALLRHLKDKQFQRHGFLGRGGAKELVKRFEKTI